MCWSLIISTLYVDLFIRGVGVCYVLISSLTSGLLCMPLLVTFFTSISIIHSKFTHLFTHTHTCTHNYKLLSILDTDTNLYLFILSMPVTHSNALIHTCTQHFLFLLMLLNATGTLQM